MKLVMNQTHALWLADHRQYLLIHKPNYESRCDYSLRDAPRWRFDRAHSMMEKLRKAQSKKARATDWCLVQAEKVDELGWFHVRVIENEDRHFLRMGFRTYYDLCTLEALMARPRHLGFMQTVGYRNLVKIPMEMFQMFTNSNAIFCDLCPVDLLKRIRVNYTCELCGNSNVIPLHVDARRSRFERWMMWGSGGVVREPSPLRFPVDRVTNIWCPICTGRESMENSLRAQGVCVRTDRGPFVHGWRTNNILR